ncbi:serine hydrolase domain-containing protein [Maridesulfovibrio frigidus]|uniref:serine hydrolase domain-containing protein n=1 Tax=Maridesulfovibrio frigidus TaxID=340956 RepID=UPI0004E15BF2|nr:serine hydrolase domain-containing protein [Maridesulfovibrio frigidus]
MKISVLIILIVLVNTFVMISYVESDVNDQDELQLIFKEAVKGLNIPGAVMLIHSPNGKETSFVAGVRDINSNPAITKKYPMTSNLKFRIGSITKTFVASVVLMLVQEGGINLDMTVREILPGLVINDTKITIGHLLQMRSGLTNFSFDEGFLKKFRAQPWYVWSPPELIAFCSTSGRDDDLENISATDAGCYIEHDPRPGAHFEYNNSNYVVLGMIVEKLTNDKIENQIYHRILKPLGLNNTSFPSTSSKLAKPYAKGYDYDPSTGTISNLSQRINPSWAWGSANGVSTATDVMKWLRAYLDGYGISKELLAEQMQFISTSYAGVLYGFGMMNKYGAIGHNGNYAGIYTAMACKFKGYYFVILTNGQSYGGERNASAESVFWRVVNKANLFKN